MFASIESLQTNYRTTLYIASLQVVRYFQPLITTRQKQYNHRLINKLFKLLDYLHCGIIGN